MNFHISEVNFKKKIIHNTEKNFIYKTYSIWNFFKVIFQKLHRSNVDFDKRHTYAYRFWKFSITLISILYDILAIFS